MSLQSISFANKNIYETGKRKGMLKLNLPVNDDCSSLTIYNGFYRLYCFSLSEIKNGVSINNLLFRQR